MKRARRIGLTFLAGLGLVVAAFFVYVSIETGVLKDASHVQASLSTLEPRSVKVDGVKLYAQPDGFSCAATTVSVAASFLRKQEIPPEALIAKYGTGVGKSDAQFIGVFAAELPEHPPAGSERR